MVEERKPDIAVGGLSIWINHRQFETSTDFWDGNWVYAKAEFKSPDSWVRVTGSFLHLSDILHWLPELESMNKDLKGKATLHPMEPNLSVTMEMDSTGHIDVKVEITPDFIYERHEFNLQIDQSHLPKLIQDIKDLQSRLPMRGER